MYAEEENIYTENEKQDLTLLMGKQSFYKTELSLNDLN